MTKRFLKNLLILIGFVLGAIAMMWITSFFEQGIRYTRQYNVEYVDCVPKNGAFDCRIQVKTVDKKDEVHSILGLEPNAVAKLMLVNHVYRSCPIVNLFIPAPCHAEFVRFSKDFIGLHMVHK